MNTNELQSTLFVGIDVRSKSNYAYAMDFFGNKHLSFGFSINQPGADTLVNSIFECLNTNKCNHVIFAMEATSFYCFHLCCVLASSNVLVSFAPVVYCLNPKVISAYRESFVSLDKTDPLLIIFPYFIIFYLFILYLIINFLLFSSCVFT